MRISSCTRSRRSFRDLASPWITIGSAMIEPMVMRGFREAYGSWKIICMRRRMRRISPGFMRVSSWPSNMTSPEVGLYSMSMTRPRVVLPQPLSPTSPSVSPRLISKLTPSTALTSATLRWKMIPEVTGKYIRMSSTRTMVSPAGPALGGFAASTTMLSPLRGRRRLRGLGYALPLPAGAVVGRANRQQRGHLLRAAIHGEAAARPEGAARRDPHEVRRHPLDRVQLLLARLVQTRHRLEESQRVGVTRLVVKLERRGRLHDLPGVHHVHPIRVARDDAQVVGDDDHGGAQLSGEAGQQLQDLGLDRHVEGGRGFVGQEELGVAGERHRDHDALAHAARELVGVIVDAGAGLRDANHLQQLDGALGGGGAVHLEVQLQRLRELAADGEDGVQGGHRLLEDHGDLVAAYVPDLVLVHLEEVLAIEVDGAADDPARRHRDQAEDGERGDRLAAA